MNKWLTGKEASEIFGKKETALRKMKSRGQLQAKKEGGKVYYLYTSLQNHFGEPEVEEKERVNLNSPNNVAVPINVQEPVQQESIENVDLLDREQDISRAEAEKFLKREQAIEKRLKNMQVQGKLVDADELLNDLEDILAVMWEEVRQEIDRWGIQFGYSPQKIKEKQALFNKCLKRGHQKIKKRVENARKTGKAVT